MVCVVSLLGWLALAGVGGPTFGRLSEVSSNDRANFLPSNAEATRALDWQQRFSALEGAPAIVVIEAPEAFSPKQVAGLAGAITDTGVLDGEIVGPIPSEDGKAAQFVVPVAEHDAEADDDPVDVLRGALTTAVADADLPDGTRAYVTGPAGFSTDLREAFGGIDGLLLVVALVAVLVILLVVYRSLVLPFLVLFTSVAALCAAIIAVFWMAKWGWITLDGQSQGILSILVIGAATDYSLLYVARFREAIADGDGRWAATKRAGRSAFEPILASGGTVIAGLLCLLFSDLNSNKALGPIAASGIVFAMLSALTLLPALLYLLGSAAFWPFKPKPRAKRGAQGLWARVAGFVAERPRPIWIVTALVLAIGCLGVTQLRAEGVATSDLVLRATDSAEGQRAIGRHYDAGSGSPVALIVPTASLERVSAAAKDTEGVASVTAQAKGGGPVRPGVEADDRDGRVLVNVVLDEAPDSLAAQDIVVKLRENVHAADEATLVGGETATALDARTTALHDLFRIIPLILVAIMLILAMLLRSIVAPLLLTVTTVLSYGTAMGVSALVFNGVFKFPGADPSVPLFGFVFLVALGVDYNIFLMSRVREEALHVDTREAITRGLTVTGGVITSAGIVLAATFAALAVIPIMFLVQLGFIVAFGVLLDTLVVRSLLVPALGHELGRRLWWPNRSIG